MTNKTSFLAASLFAASVSGLMAADPVESSLDSTFAKLEEAVPGKFSINARLRYEEFDAQGGPDRAGNSIRVRYGYTTPDFNGFTAMVEGESLSPVGNGDDDIHPLDQAGDGTDLNQLWVQYMDKDFGKAKVGRQIYTLDDHRFVGHVGWRQNIQTFDALTGSFSGVDNLTVNAFYLDGVERVNGNSDELDSYGVNVTYKFAPTAVLTAFYYDFEDEDTPGFDNKTLGLRYVGSTKLDSLALSYSLSYATQSDVTTGNEGDYYAADLAGTFKGVKLGVGMEVLESGFRTPFATVHKFNGFADKFLPLSGLANGLEDVYIYASYKIPVGNGIATTIAYHDFSPESGGGQGGTEIDLVAAYKINKYLTAVTKYGDYSADSAATGYFDKDKRMFTFELNFIY